MALLKRHRDLIIEIESFQGDVEQLRVIEDGVGEGTEEEFSEEYSTETRLVPQDYFEDEIIEKTEYTTVTEERPVPQVKALYPFNGQDQLEMTKNEILFLLSKTNADWWNVRKSNGVDGFVPANYVKEIEPKRVLVQVRKPKITKETKQVKKTKMVLQQFNVIKRKPEKQNLAPKIAQVLNGYNEIVQLGETRLNNLIQSIKLHDFFSECDDFERWLGEKKKQLNLESDSI
jgi:spectrin beta